MATLTAYLRQPADGGRDLDEQRQAITSWARARRHRLAGFIEEAAGAGLNDRPGLVEAMVNLGTDGIDGIVVTRLANLDEDLVTQEQLLAEVRRAGARVYSVSHDEAQALRARPGDASRTFVRRVLSAAAANEASLGALRAAARTANGGSPAYGYRMEGGQLVAHDAEQAALARIAELGASGATLREIARVLDAEGLHPKRAERWHPESIRRILQRTKA
jgi:DNA invertase Pin-like site-specific DNA recombinase